MTVGPLSNHYHTSGEWPFSFAPAPPRRCSIVSVFNTSLTPELVVAGVWGLMMADDGCGLADGGCGWENGCFEIASSGLRPSSQ